MLSDMSKDVWCAENITLHHQGTIREHFKLLEHPWILYLWT